MSAAFYAVGNTLASKWCTKDEGLLREHYATMPWPELTKLLGKPRSAIYAKAFAMNLTREGVPARTDAQNFTIGRVRVLKVKPTAKPVALPVLNSTVNHKEHPYNGAELRFQAARPGALDAYALPSRAGDRRTYRAEDRNA